MDAADLHACAAECRLYAAACGHPRLAALALEMAEAFEAEAARREGMPPTQAGRVH